LPQEGPGAAIRANVQYCRICLLEDFVGAQQEFGRFN